MTSLSNKSLLKKTFMNMKPLEVTESLSFWIQDKMKN